MFEITVKGLVDTPSKEDAIRKVASHLSTVARQVSDDIDADINVDPDNTDGLAGSVTVTKVAAK